MIKENQRYTEPDITENLMSQGFFQEPGVDPEKEVPVQDPVKPVRKMKHGRKAVQEFLGGDYLSREWVTGNILFLLYLAFLALIYIGNTYSTEKIYKDIERTKSELKELRYHYITAKATLMYESRQSVISVRAVKSGLNQTSLPPYKILYSPETLKTGQHHEGH